MKTKFLLAATLLTSAVPGQAVEVTWADWTSSTSTTVSGSLATLPDAVDITFSSSSGFAFVQTGGGTYWWTEGTPKPYTGGAVSNAPSNSDIIALGTGGTKTISFSAPISDLYIAFVSWNGNVVDFDRPFVKVSEGCGYWGCGTFSLGVDDTFVGSGEVHGILYFPGTFTSLSFTDSSEYWHGLTIGVAGLAPPPPPPGVPEPASWAMMIAGLGLAGAALRTTRRRVAFA
jgi:hypothetical protein